MKVIQKSFSVNLRILKTFLLYTPGYYTQWTKIRSSVVFLLLMFHVPIFGTLNFVMAESITLKQVSDNGYILAEMICYIPKLLPFIINGTKMKECIHYLESPSLLQLTPKQAKIMEKTSRICRRNSLIFIASMTMGFGIWIATPLFLNVRKLPLDVWLPYDFSGSLKTYYATYVWLFLGSGYPAIASAALEPLIGGLAAIAAAHLRVLQDKLENLHVFCEKRNECIYRKIQECIVYHNAILHFTELYESCFSQVVFSQFVGSMIVIGVCCLQLSMLDPLSVEFLSTLNYLLILLAQIYFYCYYGTILFEESRNITNAVYMSRWYEFDVKSQKALILLMERCKRPVVISAGRILDLSLVTFTTILRRAYSVLAVLNK